MAVAFSVQTMPSPDCAESEALVCAESRSPLPAFKNLGRGVF
jgi:hypothetical protein